MPDPPPLQGSGEYTMGAVKSTAAGVIALEHEDSGDYARILSTPSSPGSGPAWRRPRWAAHGRLFAQSWRNLVRRVRHMTLRQLLWVVTLVVLVSGSNVLQVLSLNFWLRSFPASGAPGNYTAFAVPGILYAILFLITLAVYVVIRRPDLRFATHAHGWLILIGVGFCDTFTSWLSTYAASHTSEVLQALFMNLCPLYAVVMCKYILHDPRSYWNVWIVSVFVLTIGGILAASLYGLITAPTVNDNRVWIFIFFCSVPFRVLMNVWQSLYMIVYTHDPAFVDWLRVRKAAAAPDPDVVDERDVGRASPCEPATAPACNLNTRFYQGNDTIVKLVMLVGDTVWQSVFTLALLPADALPWWGNSATVGATWTNFVDGVHSVFTIGDNFLFGTLYTLSFVMNYVAAAYLNHYSAALCSIVSQLSSPLTALLLIAVPSWNVQSGGDSPWYCNLLAVILLSIAAVVYVLWEEATDAEKTEGERELKRRELHV